MARITIDLDEPTEILLRRYIGREYVKTHGKIREVITKAITDYCARPVVEDYIEGLHPGAHVLLLDQDHHSARRLELRYVWSAVVQKRHVFVVTEGDSQTESPESILKEFDEVDLPADPQDARQFIHVVAVRPDEKHRDWTSHPAYLSMAELKPPYTIFFKHRWAAVDVEAVQNAIQLDTQVNMASETNATVLCSYPVLGESKMRLAAFSILTGIHNDVIFALNRRIFVTGLGEPANTLTAGL